MVCCETKRSNDLMGPDDPMGCNTTMGGNDTLGLCGKTMGSGDGMSLR